MIIRSEVTISEDVDRRLEGGPLDMQRLVATAALAALVSVPLQPPKLAAPRSRAALLCSSEPRAVAQPAAKPANAVDNDEWGGLPAAGAREHGRRGGWWCGP